MMHSTRQGAFEMQEARLGAATAVHFRLFAVGLSSLSPSSSVEKKASAGLRVKLIGKNATATACVLRRLALSLSR
jgi:hypothetical protein